MHSVRTCWLGGILLACQTYDREVVGLIPSQVAIKWLLWTGKQSRYKVQPTTQVNSAFRFSVLGKLITVLSG